jgi:drug/metabolite transporter (DMT)-like permease
MWSQFKVGLLLQVAFLGGCFFAISHGMPAGLVALVTGTQPLLTAIYATAVKGQKLPKLTWVGIALAFAGVFLVLSPASHELTFGPMALVGALIGLLGVTTGTIAQNSAKADGHILTSTLFQYVALTLSAGLIALCTESVEVVWSAEFAFGLLWLVVGVSTAAILLLMFMLQRGQATTVATYFYLVPVATAFMAWLLFDEPLTGIILTGMGITISGMLMVLKRKSRRP